MKFLIWSFFNAIHQGVLIHKESTFKLPGTGWTLHLCILSWPSSCQEERWNWTDWFNLLQSWTKLYIKISYLESIFVNSVAVAILPSPFPLEAALLCLQKKAWSPGFCRKQLWTGGRGILYAKPMIWKKLSCVMRINEKTFSSSFVGIVARLYSGQVISVAERTSV